MKLARCPNCRGWFELKEGVSWAKEAERVPRDTFCTVKCMGKYTLEWKWRYYGRSI